MPEKITILKDSGESINSNIVSVFMIPESGKSYIITTENAVDPHGLTVLHVSEIQGDKLVKVETDDEWSSIKTIMRAIISSSVGSYQYLPSFDKASASGQYSRDISVSAPAAKQMIDSYNDGEKQSVATTESSEALDESPAGDSIFPTAPVLSTGDEVAPGIEVVPPEEQQVVVEPSIVNPTLGDVSVPEVGESGESESNIVETPTVEEPVLQNSEGVNDSNENVSSDQEVTDKDVSIPVIDGLVEENTEVDSVDSEVSDNSVPEEDNISGDTGDVSNEENSVLAANILDNSNVEAVPVVNQSVIPPVIGPVDAVVTPQIPISQPNMQIAQQPVMNGGQPFVQQPMNNMSNSALQNLGINIDFNSQPNLDSKANLDEVVAGAQELFQEGVKNLMMVMSERIYKDLRAKEEDLRRREIVVAQREQAINEKTMAMMNNNFMQQPMMQQPVMQQPMMQQPMMQQPIVGQNINPQMGALNNAPVSGDVSASPTMVQVPNDPVNPQT